MLKKLAMFLVLGCAILSFAQVKPSFQAFDADYLSLSEASKGYHHFSIRVDYAPWAFVAEGDVKAPQGDPDMLFYSMDDDQLYIVVAYSEAPIGASDGLEYQAGIYDVMMYYSDGVDEFPTKIQNLKLSLLPPIVSGRFSVLMILAYLFITTGVAYGLLFQLAVYNKQSLPLNQKITSKGNFENSLQLVIELVVFFVPVFLALALTAIFGDTLGYTIMIVLGVAMTAVHPYWLRNIYTRMMRRRYENIEGFHATR